MAYERERRKKRVEPVPSARQEEDASYGPVKPFNRKKLTMQLLTVAAVALAIAIGLSIFFKVDTISISGLEKYSYDSVREASGILEGDSLLFFSRAEVSSKIRQELPYVKSVRIGITLPGTVHIVIEEVAVAYAVQDSTGAWWLISAEGTVLEKTDGATANTHTVINGVLLSAPEAGQQAKAAEQSNGETVVTGADRLAAALEVAQAMEKNEILGEFTVIDVSSLFDLRLQYGADYKFRLGDHSQLDLKIANIKGALPKILADYPPGTLDVSKVAESGSFPFTED